MKKNIRIFLACIMLVIPFTGTIAFPKNPSNRNIVFIRSVNWGDDTGIINKFSLTEPDETIYGILTPDGVLTIDLTPVANDGAYITVYSEGEMVYYIYAADSVDIDFNEYGGEGNYTVVIVPISGDTEYTADIVW